MKRKILCIVVVVLLIAMLFPSTIFARDELKNTDPQKYYILLDLKNQIVTVYEKDSAGEYTKIVRCFLCSSGRTKLDPEDPEDKGTPTPKGIWKIGARERFGKFAAFSGEYARYWTQIVGGVYFHSVLFGKRDINALKRGAYSSLGNNVSHGCVRLYVEDAKWLYYNACPGTVINVSTSEESNKALKKALKSTMSFADYNEMQKKIYDKDELPNLRAWISVESAELRTGNGSNDRVIKRLEKDTEIEILQEGDPWVKVLYDKKEGYVKLAHITYEQGVMQSREDADIIKSTAYMYQEPNKDSDEIVKVPTYTAVKIIEPDHNGWTKIQYFDAQGYMQTKNLTKGWGTIRE
jgi:SH3-like domain-containing protein